MGVLPTHRRRGLLTRLMRAQLEDIRGRGEPLAALWASEETIYGRYGYGLASLDAMMRATRVHAELRPELPHAGTVRLVGHDEALRVFPRIYERVRRKTVGFLSRSPARWDGRLLDDPARRRGGGVLNHALLELDGRAAGYALYRIKPGFEDATNTSQVEVIEAFGDSPTATRELWRFLLGIDWIQEIHCDALAGRPSAAPPRAAPQQAQLEGVRRTLAAAGRRPCGALGARRTRRTAASRSR